MCDVFDAHTFVFAKGKLSHKHRFTTDPHHLSERFLLGLAILYQTGEEIIKEFFEDEHIGKRIVGRDVELHVECVAQVLEFVLGKFTVPIECMDRFVRADHVGRVYVFGDEHPHIK